MILLAFGLVGNAVLRLSGSIGVHRVAGRSASDCLERADAALYKAKEQSDGTVVGWGRNDEGQSSAPAGLTNVVAIAAGERNNLALIADGTVVARKDRSGWFGGSFESLALLPGDTVVVPQKVDRETKWTFITRVVKDWTQILANLGLGIAAINTL